MNLVLSLALMQPLGTVGLALASNVAVVVQAIYLQTRLARTRDGLGFRHVAGDLVKVIGATAIMGAVVAGGWWLWSRQVPVSPWSDGVGLAALIAAGAGVYGAVVWWSRIGGREDLELVLNKLRGRRGRSE